MTQPGGWVIVRVSPIQNMLGTATNPLNVQ
jgi:hypothetical protein